MSIVKSSQRNAVGVLPLDEIIQRMRRRFYLGHRYFDGAPGRGRVALLSRRRHYSDVNSVPARVLFTAGELLLAVTAIWCCGDVGGPVTTRMTKRLGDDESAR